MGQGIGVVGSEFIHFNPHGLQVKPLFDFLTGAAKTFRKKGHGCLLND